MQIITVKIHHSFSIVAPQVDWSNFLKDTMKGNSEISASVPLTTFGLTETYSEMAELIKPRKIIEALNSMFSQLSSGNNWIGSLVSIVLADKFNHLLCDKNWLQPQLIRCNSGFKGCIMIYVWILKLNQIMTTHNHVRNMTCNKSGHLELGYISRLSFNCGTTLRAVKS